MSTPSSAPASPETRPASPPLLEVTNMRVRFHEDDEAVDIVRGISFSIHAGETLCLVGESGCGKSMTALSILRLTPAGSHLEGCVALDGTDLLSLPEEAMRRMRGRQCAMIFQEPMTSLNPVLQVGDQVAEPLMLHLGLKRSQAMERVVQLFQQVGIPAPTQRVHDYPHQLSGGMRQRVMIAMALACNPSLLLADEPTTALDVTIQGQILALLREQTAGRGMGLLLITHDLGVVAATADTVGVMYAGQIVELAPVQELFAEPLHPYTQGLMDSAPTPDAPRGTLATIAGTVPSPDHLPSGCAFAPRCRHAMPRCAEEAPAPCTPRSPQTGRMVRCWLHEQSA